MASWTFDADAESWTGASWISDEGSPGVGCLGDEASPELFNVGITGLSVVVSPGDAFSCQWRMLGSGMGGGGIGIGIYDSGGTVLGEASLDSGSISFSGGDTGWNVLSGTISTAGTAYTVSYTSYNQAVPPRPTACYVDTVYLAESPAVVLGLRLLKMASDSGILYVTGIQDNDLSLITYPLGSLTPSGTATFGTADYTEPDTFVRAIYPAVSQVDGWVWAYGRDGNNKQVLLSTNSGVVFTDAGPGTATWATTKFCASLMVAPLNPVDVIAAFYDNDIYQSVAGTATQWTKRGDNPNGIRTASRHPNFTNEFMTAGTAAGTIHYTPNWGQSFTHVGGTVVAGTINAIMVSRW